MTERLTSKNGVQPLSEGRTTRKRKQMSETILTAENLKFRYDSEQPGYALNGVSMQVKRGEFVAVLGANGCGKSTLAKHFNAILLPESGRRMALKCLASVDFPQPLAPSTATNSPRFTSADTPFRA